MKNLSAYALILISFFSFATQAAQQATVTRFAELQTRLVLKPGQSYLSFMQKKVKPALDAFEQTITESADYKANRYSKLQAALIAEGAGVAVRIDRSNYIFNVGYLDGSQTDDVKSGRSYGVGPTGLESDPSDLAYLSELEDYLIQEPHAAAGGFVEALMKVLTNCDTSGWAKLSTAGQIVATDFLAIYTAESDRHIMVGLKPSIHPWEIDLAAATFVSIFNTSTGLIMQDGEVQKGSVKQWWAKGRVGSGIGETRRDRIALQKLIGQNLADSAGVNKIVAEIADQIGSDAKAEVIQSVLLYLNSAKAPEHFTSESSEALTNSFTNYLLKVQSEAPKMARSLVN